MGLVAVGGIEISGKTVIGPTVRGTLTIPTLVGRLPQLLHQFCLLRLLLIKTSIGKGAHVLHR